MEALRLQSGQDPQRLGIALEAAAVCGQPMQHALPVVAEGRMPEIMGEACRVDDIRITAQQPAQLPPDLRHFQRMRQPGAREVVHVRRDDLCLGAQPAKRRGMQQTRPVPLERGPVHRLAVLGHPALGIGVGISGAQGRIVPFYAFGTELAHTLTL